MSHLVDIAEDDSCSGEAYLSLRPIAYVFFVLLFVFKDFDNPKSASFICKLEEDFRITF